MNTPKQQNPSTSRPWRNVLYCSLSLLAAFTLFTAVPSAPAQTNWGNAVSLNGTSNYVRMPEGYWFGNQFTIEAWVYERSYANYVRIIDFGNHLNSDGVVLCQETTTGKPALYIFRGTESTSFYAPQSLPLNQWTHLAVTVSNNVGVIYTNGVAAATNTGLLPPNNVWRTNAFVGRGNYPSDPWANAVFDDLRIWNVARTPAQIAEAMARPLAGTESNLLAYWKFNEAAGTRVYDATTNHLDGTLNNRPLRVPSLWAPSLAIGGANPYTNECHSAFSDPGATVSGYTVAIAAGGSYSLALRADGGVVGWGDNVYGQTIIPASATNVVAIAAGSFHSLALRADGTVLGWGYGRDGQTNSPASATDVVAIAAGRFYSLALRTDGTVLGWGRNDYGQLSPPPNATKLVAIAAGYYHSLALRADGTVVGWGMNNSGQATIPASATNVVAIAAGGDQSLALRADGTVLGWGNNFYGQITIPTSATNVVAIAAGDYHSLALRADGTVLCWGNKTYGQTNVVAIAAGGSHSLALRADSTVIGWGGNNYGQTNIPAGVNIVNLPVAVSGTVNTNSSGSYLLTYSTTNGLGAVANATRTVQVVDTQGPEMTLLGDNPLAWQAGRPFTDPGASATDLCAGDLTGSIVTNLTVNPSLLGIYTNTYSVTDAAGNSAQTNRTVLVVQLEAATLAPSGLLNSAATLNGSVSSTAAGDTTAWFEWGSTAHYGSNTPPQSLGSGLDGLTVSASLEGLTPGATYHYRCVASNSVGMVRGSDQTFWLPALSLNGPNSLTNECHFVFNDPGATVSGYGLGIAAGGRHSLALRADGAVVGWGYGGDGQTTIPASATNIVAIAAGYYHSVALRADGMVLAWGYNNFGQTNVPASATNVVAISAAAGRYHSLALRADGTVVGWGYNELGQANSPASATNVVAIAAGGDHSLALRADGTVLGWGFNVYGQANSPGVTNVVAIAAGMSHSLALLADGTVLGWGGNSYGQTSSPARATNVVAIAAGQYHSLALRADGTVVSWGRNNYGQTNSPADATNVVAIAAGENHNLALRADGTVVGWGRNNDGQTDIPAGLHMPVAVSGMVDTNSPGTYILTYSTTNAQGAVATATRTVQVVDPLPPEITLLGDSPLVWQVGRSFIDPGATATDLCSGDLTGSIVSNITVNPSVPGIYTNTYTVTDAAGHSAQTKRTVVVGFPSAATLPVSGLLNGAATLNGSVNANGAATMAWFEWGSSGRYGSNTAPQSVGSGSDAVALSALLNGFAPGVLYHYRCVASNAAETVRGVDQVFWLPAVSLVGPNALTNECHHTFTDPGGAVSGCRLAIAAGYYHSLALRADGTVLVWGDNTYGQTNTPASATNVVAIAAAHLHSLALRADGTVVGWGHNFYGQTNLPAGATNVVAIAAGYLHSLALRADGMLLGWGDNSNGQTTIPASATNVVAIAAGYVHSLALRADGTLLGWGYNGNGQINIPASATNVVAIAAGGYHNLALRADGTAVGWGLNNSGQATIPVSATNVVAIAAGDGHSLALRADGTLLGWGYNGYGQTTIPASATNVVAIAAGYLHSLALRADGTLLGWGYNGSGQTTIPAGLNMLNLPNAVSGFVNTNSPGIYLLTYSTTNKLGAVATATRTVNVVDALPPEMTLLGNNPLVWQAGTPFTDLGATATDLCAGDLTGSIVTNIMVNASLPGIYTNTYSVTDASGNSAQTNRIVLVVGGPWVAGMSAQVAATNIHSGSRQIVMAATVSPNGLETVAFIRFGLSTAYSGSSAPTLLSASYAGSNLTGSLEGVIPGVIYHWTVYASNALGVAAVPDQTFTVPALFAPGDANGDGLVDNAEFAGVLANLNGNGSVSQGQLDMVLSNYWPSSPWLYITNTAGLGGENVTFSLTNSTAGAFSVWMSTDLQGWQYLGPATPRYEFFDTNAPALPQRFYRLSYP